MTTSQATDILLDPVKPSLPRYAAYIRARHRFWDAFPDGTYTRLPTPGTNLECGLYALRLSVENQCSLTPTSTMRVPTMGELRAVFKTLVERGVVMDEEEGGWQGEGWFTVDQLAAVFSEWGKRFLGEKGVRCQLGYVTADDGLPVMMNTAEVETGEVGEGIVRVWVWNDGMSLRGGVGHFEGMKRSALEGEDGKGGEEREAVNKKIKEA